MVNMNIRERATLSGKCLYCASFAAMCLAILVLSQAASAGTLEVMPKLIVKYSVNDNMYANDPDDLAAGQDPVTASYIDYLVGIRFKFAAAEAKPAPAPEPAAAPAPAPTPAPL